MSRVISDSHSANRDTLAAFDAAWTAQDLATLMRFVAPDCVYAASVGPEPGETFRGREEVRAGFTKMLEHDAGRVRRSGRVWHLGDVAFAEWSFEEQTANGVRVIRGIDRIEFSPDGMVLKDAFRKTQAG